MTFRDRMNAVFRGETPDKMPFFGDLTYWYAAHEKIGDLPDRWRGPNGLAELHKELNIGRYIPGCEPWDTSEGAEVRTEIHQDTERIVRQWHTPIGSIREEQQYCASSYSWGYTEHAVKNAQDLRVLRYLFEHRTYTPVPERFIAHDRPFLEYGHGPSHVAAPATPISELNKHWIGVLDLTYLMVDEPEEFQQTLDVIAEAHDRLYRIIARSPAKMIMICENLTAETMGGFFDQYIAPHLLRWTGWLHEAGQKALLHNDGTLRGTLEKLAAAGIDCVDSVTPEPVGDVPIKDLRSLAGEKILLLGGLPGAMFAPPFDAKAMEHHVKQIIHYHKASRTFMFGVADQVPPNGDLNLIKLIADLIDQHGRY